MRTTAGVWGVLLLGVVSCASTEEEEEPGVPACIEGGSSWTGQPAFRDASSAWRLNTVQAFGTRISAADIDGDGWTDVFSRRAGTLSDDFSPGGTRATWLLRNDHGTFRDVTESSGIVQPRTGSGGRPSEIAVFADVDNDGDLDAFTGVDTTNPPANQARATSELMLNDGRGRFTLAEHSDLRHDTGPVPRAAAAFTDFDRDGLVDLWIGVGGSAGPPEQDQLYRNTNGAAFAEVTAAAGLITQPAVDVDAYNAGLVHTRSWGVNACDLDDDGTPELLSASYGRAPNHLWVGERDAQGAVTWRNESVDSGYAYDLNQDWSDSESARCFCQSYPETPGCEGVPAPEAIQCPGRGWDPSVDTQPFRLGGNSGTTLCADFDNDGSLDLLTSEIVHWDVGQNSDTSEILYNDGAARFTRPGNARTGLTRRHDRLDWNDGEIINGALDFDNDGRLDVYLASEDYPGTRGWLFHQKADGTFEPVPLDLGIDHTSSAGVVAADFDRDGDVDLVIGHSRFRCTGAPGDHCYPPEEAYVRLFENVSAPGNWIQLRLEGGPGTNRAAIGARVTVRAGDLVQVQEVEGGHGHYGVQNDLVLHFGLGPACEAEVTIRWPDAALTTQTFTVPARQRYHVVQSKGPAVDAP